MVKESIDGKGLQMKILEKCRGILRDSYKVAWKYISTHQKLSEAFIERHQDKVNWEYISIYQKLSEAIIERYQDKVDWNHISSHQSLSEGFIGRFHDRVDWWFISKYQFLSESFIETHQDKVNWYCILEYQNHPKSDYHTVHHCGDTNRIIRISKFNVSIIEMGCFRGTQKEAIEAVSKKYSGKAKDDYINKINECFKLTLS